MKVECCWIGKTQEPYLEEGITRYEKRLKHYLPFEAVLIPDIRGAGKAPPEEIKRQEGERLLARVKPEDFLVLLDEKGQSFSSTHFARWLDQRMQWTHKRLIFISEPTSKTVDALSKLNMPAGVDIRIKA